MGSHLLIRGDSRRIPIDLSRVDAVVTDPPYGMNWDTDTQRFSGGIQRRNKKKNDFGDIEGDREPFDPAPWIDVPKLILWGANHFACRLPVGTTLIWIKRHEHLFGTFLSDAEIGWMKGGYGVYCFRKPFSPPVRMAESGLRTQVAHPNQKPVSLMRWCIRKLKLKPNSLILDPYMGSGSIGLAALAEGHRFIGIELKDHYCRIAARRLERPHAPVARPTRDESFPLFACSEATP